MDIMKFLGRGRLAWGFLLGGVFLAGCQSGPDISGSAPGGDGRSPAPVTPVETTPKMDVFRIGDTVSVSFSDLANPMSPITADIKEDGTITLAYNEQFVAQGKSLGELQLEIRERYVPKYFKYMTPVVRIADRFYFVSGEVRLPNRQVFTGSMTVLGAISSVGGFSEFARKTKVQVTRANGEKFTVNCLKALQDPALDKPIYPGDKINVPKRLW
jgi:protein involved in polysaccharide export with SLBB domain